MSKYIVKIKDETEYKIDDAKTPEEAKEIACEYWDERLPEVEVAEIPDVRNVIEQTLNADDCDAKCEAFAEAFFKEIDSDDEPYRKSGKYMLKAIKENNLSDFLIAVCGWSAESLMKKACIMHDYDTTFHRDKEKAVFVSVWDNGEQEVETDCYVDMSTFEVFDIRQAPEVVAQECSNLDEEYIEINGRLFSVYRKDEMPEDNVTAFWYK